MSVVQLKTYPIMLGKSGITNNLVQHIVSQLKQHSIVKIRVLKSSGLSVEQAISELEKKTKAKVIKKIGKTFVLT